MDISKIMKEFAKQNISMADIAEEYKKQQTAIAQENKQKELIADAKADVVESMLCYLEALGIIKEDTPDKTVDKYTSMIEHTIDSWEDMVEGKPYRFNWDFIW